MTTTAVADTALVHEVGARAISWLSQHREGFRPTRDEPAYPGETADPAETAETAKPGGQAARDRVSGALPTLPAVPTPPGYGRDWEIKDRLKPIGELAQISKVLFREGVAGSRQAALTRQLLDYAWRELLEGGQLLGWMHRQEPVSPLPFEI